jgi:hypothetical protein
MTTEAFQHLKPARATSNEGDDQNVGVWDDISRRDFLLATVISGASLSALWNREMFGMKPLSNLRTEKLPIVPFSSFRRYKSLKLSNGMKVCCWLYLTQFRFIIVAEFSLYYDIQ